jgi:hypothetical protein
MSDTTVSRIVVERYMQALRELEAGKDVIEAAENAVRNPYLAVSRQKGMKKVS